MLTVNNIRENCEEIKTKLAIKNFTDIALLDKVIELDDKRKKNKMDFDNMQSAMKKISKEIGELFRNKKIDEANKAKEKTTSLKEKIKNLSAEKSQIEQDLQDVLIQIPNIPHESVPAGKTEEDNEIIKTSGKAKEDKNLMPHWELAERYNLIDFELGNKITGAGFPVYKGAGAKLQRALISYFLDKSTEDGYNEVMPPVLVNEASAFSTGQLPDKEGQMYELKEDKLFLIPTAEVPVTNIFRDTIINPDDFPIKYTAYTPCFRREAGSYGKDVRGLNRLHQFDKVEIVQIVHPEESYKTLDLMVEYVESVVKSLELPYRILRLCGGDLSFTSALTFDFEVWSAAQQKWLEVSSVSNFENYQANRLKLRYKDKESKKTKIAHTLNGSALALPRIVAAILENYQKEDGIEVPEVLQKYMNTDKIL